MEIEFIHIKTNILLNCLPQDYDEKVRIVHINKRAIVIHPDIISIILPYHYVYTEALIVADLKKRFEMGE